MPRSTRPIAGDPDAVRAAMAHAGTSPFVLASKSGSTIEPSVRAAEAERRRRDAGIADSWPRFMAITNEGTPLHARATRSGFRVHWGQTKGSDQLV